MGDRTGRKARLLGSRRVHGRQGRRERIHRSVEPSSTRVQRHVARDKLAHRTLVHQRTQRSLNIAGSSIQRRNNIGSRNRQRLQRQPCVDRTSNIPRLERRIQRTLPVGKLTRTTAARQQHAPAANKHHGRIGQHHGMVSGT